MNKATRRFFGYGIAASVLTLMCWMAQVIWMGLPVSTWWFVPLALVISLSVFLVLVHWNDNRRERRRVQAYLIDLRRYKKNPLSPPTPVPWHVGGLTQRDVQLLMKNRSNAWDTYYDFERKRLRNGSQEATHQR